MKLMYFAMGGVYPFNIGGTSTVAYNLLRQFDKLNMNVHFVFVILKKNTPIQGLRKFFKVSDNVFFHPITKEDYKLDVFGGGVGAFKLTNLVNTVKPDIIHYNLFPSKRDLLIPWIAKMTDIPQVYTYHGRFWKEVEENYPSPLSYLFKNQFKAYRLLYSKVIVNSKSMVKNAIYEGFDPNKIICIPNGIDLEVFEKAEPRELDGKPSILFVGRLEDVKGVDTLIKAFQKISAISKRAKLHIVGTGSKFKSLEETADRYGISHKVIFHGFRSDVGSFYKGADICIFPSGYDPSGIVLLEAMACKCPTICSNRGAVSEIIRDKETGILMEPTVENLASATVNLWENEELRNKIAFNAYKTSLNYSWVKIAKKYVKVYKNIIE